MNSQTQHMTNEEYDKALTVSMALTEAAMKLYEAGMIEEAWEVAKNDPLMVEGATIENMASQFDYIIRNRADEEATKELYDALYATW